MKHRLLITLALLLGLTTLNTQNSNAQEFEWGVRDGLTFSSLIGIENTLPQIGFYAGFVSNYFFNNHWGVGTDITLSEQGTTCMENSDGVYMEYCYDYLNIPILGQYQMGLGDGQRLRFVAGVQLGVFLIAKCEYEAPSITGEGVVSGVEYFDSKTFHPIDFGATVGAQWLLDETTSIEARYTLGITQTHNGISNTLDGYYYISVPDNRNSVFQIGTSFLF